MPDSRQTDAAARQRIRQDLQTNILVEAGAGSGKTQMLAERMAAGVAEGDYVVEQMAAVTFTRKAASELRGRFHLALEARLQKARADGEHEQAVRLDTALSNLERFFAGTIHSFCARLLRERPVESHVSPGFNELDEVQDLELRQRVWREFVTSARRAGDPDVMALLEADVKPKDLDHAFARVCDNEDVDFPPGDGTCPDPKPAVQALAKFWSIVSGLMPSTVPDEAKCQTLLAAKRFEGRWRVSQKRLHRRVSRASRATRLLRRIPTWRQHGHPVGGLNGRFSMGLLPDRRLNPRHPAALCCAAREVMQACDGADGRSVWVYRWLHSACSWPCFAGTG